MKDVTYIFQLFKGKSWPKIMAETNYRYNNLVFPDVNLVIRAVMSILHVGLTI